VLSAIQECRNRYYVAPRTEAASWRELREPVLTGGRGEGGAGGGGSGGDGQQRPDTLPCLEFKLVWYRQGGSSGGSSTGGPGASGGIAGPGGGSGGGAGQAAGQRAVSVWRPVGPPGYAALGDVAVVGTGSPPQPVRLYKDPLSLGGDGDAPGEGPRLARPVSYALMFRDSANPPCTIWRPVPPRGYVEVSGRGLYSFFSWPPQPG
jgi:hypothetical protein